ncbi:GDSL-type esterase/lipase family protein [Clostridium chauvoei]|uniref:GDSL family lipase n=3 Tax=Clostridium chauvoei TaxID=46867 RepID=A0ABD4RK35_9CLOT|nr:GDSL-type esterase/lipase family protein [Clostridium chauvoei]ATD55967.1 GDSL family lipase [Clostridium chauvoei]ATD56362.1 GDSL family lipase [Clostridium chauvoei]MBX7281567.1 GDSL family lipase [Clostridium chauvoei]MBX7284094.1 GDSL family lipase [Clostridium chauvoei]MBX7286615.1 GDSL family lipase [Clostridium chauvoei]
MDNKNFVFIGDSLIFGYGVPKNKNWVTKLNDALDFNIINKGINGNTTTDMLVRFSEDVISNKPKLIFLMGGTNDLLSNRPVDFIISNIELMIKEGLESNSKVILGIPPTIIGCDANELFAPSNTYNYCEHSLPILKNKLMDLCKKYNLSFIDFYKLTIDNLNKNIFSDGIHLNSHGQNLLFEEALKIIKL